MKSKKRVIILCIAFISLFSIKNSFSQVIVKVRPVRPDVVMVKPAHARKNFVWINGNWIFDKRINQYVWLDGRWARIPRGKNKWIDGHWAKVPGGWKYVPGHWV